MFWSVGAEKEVGAIEAAHEGIGMVSHKKLIYSDVNLQSTYF